MIEKLLPSAVVTVESFTDSPDAILFPEEAAALARAVPSRRREFATGRSCARAGMARLGLPPMAVARGARGEPQWPPGVVGSITHCDGYRAAAVAHAADAAALGIDAEPDGPLPDDVLALVSSATERADLADLARTYPGVAWDRLLFSAKESVYKAWFALQQTFLDFTEAVLDVDPEGRFRARLLVPGPVVGGRELRSFTGRFSFLDGLVLTAVHVPSPLPGESVSPDRRSAHRPPGPAPSPG